MPTYSEIQKFVLVVSCHWCPKSAKPSSRPFGISV